MADRIFTSSVGEDILTLIHRSTKLDFSTIARLAFAYSLSRCGTQVQESSDFSGKEIRRNSIFGGNENLYRSVVRAVYQSRFADDDEFFSRKSVVKDHLDNGLIMFESMLAQSNGDFYSVLRKIIAELRSENSIAFQGDLLDLIVGRRVGDGQSVHFRINDSNRHANFHLAIMGKPGTGKTQVLLKLISDIRVQSNYKTNFIFLDYKGDVAANQRFGQIAKSQCYHLPRHRLPVNPFVLENYGEASLRISAREKAESFGSISSRIGPIQKGLLQDAILLAYEKRRGEDTKYPDLRETYDLLDVLYQKSDRKVDSLTEVMRDLAEFGLFWEHGSTEEPLRNLWQQSIIVDLHELPVLKEMVAYLIIERLYKELSSLPDSNIFNGRRQIRTVLVIDEAHNYLPQRNIFLERIVREGRSKGVAVFLVSQSPTDFLQKSFDFRELLEFVLVFQCEGVSSKAIQELLGCTNKIAIDLQSEIAKLQPFNVIARDVDSRHEYVKFIADPFFESYQSNA